MEKKVEKVSRIYMFMLWGVDKCNGLLVDMKKSSLAYFLSFGYVLCYLLNSFLFADRIITNDGSELNGKLLLFEDGNLTFMTDFAGKIRISTNNIKSFSTDGEISIRLDDNRTYQSKILQAKDSKILIEESQITPSFSEVRHLWPSDNEDPLLVEMQEKAKLLVMSWKNSLGFDLTGASGNTENFGIGARLDSQYGNKLRKYDMYLSYNNSSKKDQTIVDETKLGLEYDSRFFEQLSWYAKTDLENDRLEEVDLRATTALGIKYSWIEEKSYKVSLRSGLAFRFEEYGLTNEENVDALALDFGIEYDQLIKDSLYLKSDITIVPSVEELSDYLISKDTAFVIPLDKNSDWNLRTGLDGTYNSTPVKNKEELDLKYYVRIIYRLD